MTGKQISVFIQLETPCHLRTSFFSQDNTLLWGCTHHLETPLLATFSQDLHLHPWGRPKQQAIIGHSLITSWVHLFSCSTTGKLVCTTTPFPFSAKMRRLSMVLVLKNTKFSPWRVQFHSNSGYVPQVYGSCVPAVVLKCVCTRFDSQISIHCIAAKKILWLIVCIYIMYTCICIYVYIEYIYI